MDGLAAALSRSLGPSRPDPQLAEGIPAAVLLPVIDTDEPTLLFTVRSEAVRHHKGEISFPGGARHPEDPDLLATALRETEEELGVGPDRCEILGALPWTETFVSGFVVVPFVARLAERPPLTLNEGEVAAVLELDLARLAAAERLEPREWRGATYHTYEYRLDGHVVWGVTGRILHTLLDTLERGGWTWQKS